MKPRECSYCLGTKVVYEPTPWPLGYVPDTEPCPQCNGSGAVWPSVEGEIVLHVPSLDKAYRGLRLLDWSDNASYRIIAQPVDQEKGEKGADHED